MAMPAAAPGERSLLRIGGGDEVDGDGEADDSDDDDVVVVKLPLLLDAFMIRNLNIAGTIITIASS